MFASRKVVVPNNKDSVYRRHCTASKVKEPIRLRKRQLSAAVAGLGYSRQSSTVLLKE